MGRRERVEEKEQQSLEVKPVPNKQQGEIKFFYLIVVLFLT